MTLVQSFTLPFQSERVELSASVDSRTAITMVIGENGVKKSFLLRGISIAAISSHLHRKKQHLDSQTEVAFSERPAQIVAISGTATDRFPARSRRGDGGSGTRFDTDRYVYVGPRTARNIISRSQSSAELIFLVLSKSELLSERKIFLSGILTEIGSPDGFSFELEIARTVRGSGRSKDLIKEGTFREFLEISAGSFEHNTSLEVRLEREQELTSIDAYAMADKLDIHLFGPTSDWPPIRREQPGLVHVEIKSDGDIETHGIDPRALALAVSTGYLLPRKIVFGNSDHESLSAGQWSIFSTMYSICFAAVDGTLVLVDEPENSLHPVWQRKYIDWILSALGTRKKCHVILATHSPLIIGATGFDNSEICVLRKLDDKIIATVCATPVGADSNSILEDVFGVDSARGIEITELVNSALSLISEGIFKNREKLMYLDAKLEYARNHLSAGDVLRHAIDSIRNSYRAD